MQISHHICVHVFLQVDDLYIYIFINVHVTQRERDDVVVASNKTAHDRVLPREELLPVARNVSQADDISSVGFTSLRLAGTWPSLKTDEMAYSTLHPPCGRSLLKHHVAWCGV